MTDQGLDIKSLNQLGSLYLVKALKNCSEETKQEVTEELEKLRNI